MNTLHPSLLSEHLRIKQKEILSKLCVGRGVDVGCGANKISNATYGVDVTDVRGQKVDYFAYADNLSMFKDNELDYVVSCHCIEHIANTKKVLKEWWRVLVDKGKLGIATPNVEKYSYAIETVEHLSFFTLEILKRVVETCGFDVEEIYEFEEASSRGSLICVAHKNINKKVRYAMDTERWTCKVK